MGFCRTSGARLSLEVFRGTISRFLDFDTGIRPSSGFFSDSFSCSGSFSFSPTWNESKTKKKEGKKYIHSHKVFIGRFEVDVHQKRELCSNKIRKKLLIFLQRFRFILKLPLSFKFFEC